MLAGVAMAMSSVTVVGNSILLGRYKPRFTDKKRKGDVQGLLCPNMFTVLLRNL
jgi:hypothetical protein